GQHAEDLGKRRSRPGKDRRAAILERLGRRQLTKREVHERLKIAGDPYRWVGRRWAGAGQEPAVPELEMKHLVADVELERLPATRIPELGLGSRPAPRDELGAGGLWVDAIVDREIEPPQPEGDQWIAQSLSLLGELIDRDAGGRREGALADDSCLLESSQSLGEPVAPDRREDRQEVLEPLGTEQQLADHQHRPALAEDIQRAGERAHLPVGLGRHPPSIARDAVDRHTIRSLAPSVTYTES